jgi:hypothetical protein
MAYFKINTKDVHFSFIAELHNSTQIHFGFSPRGGSAGQEKYNEVLKVLTHNIGHTGTLAFLGMVTTINLGVVYKFPLIGAVTSTLLVNEVNKFITSRDGKGVVHSELHHPNLTNNKANFPLSLDQEKLLLNFIDYREDNCPKYEVYNYNCASFVKEAFCVAYPTECSSFKKIVMNQVYENPTISNLAAVAFLNTIGALD